MQADFNWSQSVLDTTISATSESNQIGGSYMWNILVDWRNKYIQEGTGLMGQNMLTQKCRRAKHFESENLESGSHLQAVLGNECVLSPM